MDEAVILRLMAFVHPAWMLLSLVAAVATARLGLEIRKRRLAGRPAGAARRRQHLRLGKLTLLMIAVGFVAGPLSMAFLRDRAIFDSFHSILGIIVAGLFAWTGWSGRALAGGNSEARDIHRIAAGSSMAVAFVSAVAGFTLLP